MRLVVSLAHVLSGLIAVIAWYVVDRVLTKLGVGEGSLGGKVTKVLLGALGGAALSLWILFSITGTNPLS